MAIRTLLDWIARSGGGSYAATRAAAELDYLSRLARARPGLFGADLAEVEEAARRLAERTEASGSLSSDDLSEMEAALAPRSAACKSLSLVCVGHAHIDMNWMWGFQETVSIAIETMRTALGLMDRYPDFHFSQSQASVYRIVERYAPELMRPIASRIAAGRWESLACQWVETDMVLPSGESLVRQMLYARRYMREAYGAPESSFETVFLPDTFGYPASTPEILSSAGVKRLYHCRGADDRIAYRWLAPSGRSILAYREPRWYNTDIGAGIARFLPAFARDTGLESAPCVYGVGDHGGGPTMRDIERLADMASWPLFPSLRFGALSAWFDYAQSKADSLPTFSGEPERLFTGCYASQSRIKAANAKAQEAMYEAELLSVAGTLSGNRNAADDRSGIDLRDAWIDLLFGQFHDILPGSGVRETRERALGAFQGIMASARSSASRSLCEFAGVDSSLQPSAAPHAGEAAWTCDRNEGAGVGFGSGSGDVSAASRASDPGERRFLLFNQLQWSREETVELVLWDWPDAQAAAFYDVLGARLPSQLLEASKEPYWGHDFARYVVAVPFDGFGFASVVARDSGEESALEDYHPYGKGDWLVEKDRSYVLENERLRVVFDSAGLGIRSLVDKASGMDLVEGRGPTALFRLVEEDAPTMTAWIVGRRRSLVPLDRATRLTGRKTGSELLEQWFEFTAEAPALPGAVPSSLSVRVSLAKGSSRLRFDVTCDWREITRDGECLRQLDFAVALAGDRREALRDIPCGLSRTPASERDFPATSFMAALCEDAPAVQLTAPGRQSFRLEEGTLSSTLLRGSIDPDAYPELGQHSFSLALSVLDRGAAREDFEREALSVRHRPLAISTGGAAPPKLGSLLEVGGKGVVVSAVKRPEPEAWDGAAYAKDRLILRLYETRGEKTVASVKCRGLVAWRLLDSNERPISNMKAIDGGGAFELPMESFGIATVELDLRGLGE